MSFWSNLFSKKDKADDTSSQETVLSSRNDDSVKVNSDDLTNEELRFDENGWFTYPDGLKLKNVDGGSFTDENLRETMTSLGYHDGEWFLSLHDKNGKDTSRQPRPSAVASLCYSAECRHGLEGQSM